MTAAVTHSEEVSPEATVRRGLPLFEIAHAAGSALPCATHETDLWFSEAPGQLERAKQLCACCPAKARCLAGALARQEPWGVWGGEIFEHGAPVPRKRTRGRPRKTPDRRT